MRVIWITEDMEPPDPFPAKESARRILMWPYAAFMVGHAKHPLGARDRDHLCDHLCHCHAGRPAA